MVVAIATTTIMVAKEEAVDKDGGGSNNHSGDNNDNKSHGQCYWLYHPKKKRIEDSFDSIDDDAELGLQDDKIMEETPGDICLKERVEDSFERMKV
ncbi:hypothetical protein JHK82_012392 [Glycine max]|nr:hypothetical protein JHK85_012743 [Glycine max]KAG5057413.1 hypothetical protein JHK86_012409 [Glycine max]KAG5154423.1 hypothetical protein JHK82_012392 [Glycine max]